MKRLTIILLLAAGLPLQARAQVLIPPHAGPLMPADAQSPMQNGAQPLIAPTRQDMLPPPPRRVDPDFGLPKFGLPGETTLRHDTMVPPWEIAPGIGQAPPGEVPGEAPGQAAEIQPNARGPADFFKQDAADAVPADAAPADAVPAGAPPAGAPDFFQGNADLTLPRDATPRGPLFDDDMLAGPALGSMPGGTPFDQAPRALPDFRTADGRLPPPLGAAAAGDGPAGDQMENQPLR